LTGFLAGFVIPFDPAKAAVLSGTYRVEIDNRSFEFALDQGHFAGAHGKPDVTVTARAEDFVLARLGSTDAKRTAALRRINFDGDHDAADRLRKAFSL
jgi:hypothetical protein